MAPKSSDRISQLSLPDRVAFFFSNLLMVIGMGIAACGVAALILGVFSPQCKYAALPMGLVTIGLQSYVIASEARPHIYNFFAIFIPDVFFMAGFLAIAMSLCTLFQAHIVDAAEAQKYADLLGSPVAHDKSHIYDDTREVDIIVLAFCCCGWLLSLIRVVLLGMEITRYRRRCRNNCPDMQRNLEENLEIAEVVEISVGNDETSGNINVQARESVHYNCYHPYHPLRMHPVDSVATIRSVAPDLVGGQVPAIQSQKQHQKFLVETPPPVYTPLPS